MRRVRLILIVLALAAGGAIAAFARLQGDGPPADKVVADKGAADKGAADKGAGPGQGPRVPVIAATAGREDVPILRSSVGWVEPVATVTVRARVEGEVLAQHVEDGQLVQRGDLLFEIDDREIRAAIAKDEALLERDRAALERAQADAARARDLLARKVAAPQQVDQTEADAKIAAANVQADQAALDNDRIRLGYTSVKAPIDGRVGVVRVTPGNIVRASDGGEGLVTITQMKPLRVTFTLPERDLPALRAAAAAGTVPVRVVMHKGEDGRAEGRLDFIDSSVDAASGTITAKALIPNEDGALWPGQYVDVAIELGKVAGAVTIPMVAVQPGQDGPFVYVVGQDGTAALRQVRTGETLGQAIVIRAGLAAGERVVVEGQQRLRDGARVSETGTDKPGPARQEASS